MYRYRRGGLPCKFFILVLRRCLIRRCFARCCFGLLSTILHPAFQFAPRNGFEYGSLLKWFILIFGLWFTLGNPLRHERKLAELRTYAYTIRDPVPFHSMNFVRNIVEMFVTHRTKSWTFFYETSSRDDMCHDLRIKRLYDFPSVPCNLKSEISNEKRKKIRNLSSQYWVSPSSIVVFSRSSLQTP